MRCVGGPRVWCAQSVHRFRELRGGDDLAPLLEWLRARGYPAPPIVLAVHLREGLVTVFVHRDHRAQGTKPMGRQEGIATHLIEALHGFEHRGTTCEIRKRHVDERLSAQTGSCELAGQVRACSRSMAGTSDRRRMVKGLAQLLRQQLGVRCHRAMQNRGVRGDFSRERRPNATDTFAGLQDVAST